MTERKKLLSVYPNEKGLSDLRRVAWRLGKSVNRLVIDDLIDWEALHQLRVRLDESAGDEDEG